MRMAICKLTSEVTLLGSKESVRIGPGSQVDLDRVIGETEAKPVTVADALGAELLSRFQLVAPAGNEPRPTRRWSGASDVQDKE